MKKILVISIVSNLFIVNHAFGALFVAPSAYVCNTTSHKEQEECQKNVESQVQAQIQIENKELEQKTEQVIENSNSIEQENQKKIKELEERINTLESKPTVIEKVIPTEEVISPRSKEEVAKPTVDNKIVKPIIKKEEPKKETIEEKITPTIEITTTTETPIVPIKKPFFQRVFGWFKFLF